MSFQILVRLHLWCSCCFWCLCLAASTTEWINYASPNMFEGGQLVLTKISNTEKTSLYKPKQQNKLNLINYFLSDSVTSQYSGAGSDICLLILPIPNTTYGTQRINKEFFSEFCNINWIRQVRAEFYYIWWQYSGDSEDSLINHPRCLFCLQFESEVAHFHGIRIQEVIIVSKSLKGASFWSGSRMLKVTSGI